MDKKSLCSLNSDFTHMTFGESKTPCLLVCLLDQTASVLKCLEVTCFLFPSPYLLTPFLATFYRVFCPIMTLFIRNFR